MEDYGSLSDGSTMEASFPSPSTSIWIHFPECPLEDFEEDLLMEAAKHIGTPDNTTALAVKARFARVCVEID